MLFLLSFLVLSAHLPPLHQGFMVRITIALMIGGDCDGKAVGCRAQAPVQPGFLASAGARYQAQADIAHRPGCNAGQPSDYQVSDREYRSLERGGCRPVDGLFQAGAEAHPAHDVSGLAPKVCSGGLAQPCPIRDRRFHGRLRPRRRANAVRRTRWADVRR